MNYDGKTYRNLEGQVAYLTEVAEALDDRITEVAAQIPSKMIVEELPEEGDPLITYYVGPKGTAPNYYYEVWVWVQEEEDGPFVWRELEDTDQVDLSGYLEKQTGTSTYAQVYAKKTDGTQTMYDVGTADAGNLIALRTSGGQLNVPDNPTAANHAVCRKYVQENFVAKATGSSTYAKVYVKNADGTQGTVDAVNDAYDANSIARRDSGGRIKAANPVSWNDVVIKDYADNNYLAKQTASSSYVQVYAKATDGTQAMLNVNGNPISDSIPFRFAYGHIKLPNQITYPPTDDDYAVSKRYVDAVVGQLIYKHAITLGFTVNSKSFQLDIVLLNGTSTAYTSTDGRQMLSHIKSSSCSITTSSWTDSKFWSVAVCPSDNYIHTDTGVGFLLEAGIDGTTIYVNGIDPSYNSDITGVTITDTVTTW